LCLLDRGWRSDDLDTEIKTIIEDSEELKLEAMILLWAYAQYATNSWYEEWFDEAKIRGGLLSSKVAGLVLRAGTSGTPLDLAWMGM